MKDSNFMLRCLSLAAHGHGKVGNGALVGSVLVRNGSIIAEGYHEGFGKPHAERTLLDNFKDAIQPDDILYVNLEPCCHEGKTPPCTDTIIESGIQHAVYGMLDPDERNAGKGIAALQKAGIDVRGPVIPERCRRLNRGHISLRTKDRPWITLKRAQTPEGKIANDDGSPLKITSEEQDEWSHKHLRATHDAILVGVQTIVNDNPKLNTRFIQEQDLCTTFRFILDPNLRIPLDAQVVTDEERERTIIITSKETEDAEESKDAREVLRSQGVLLVFVDSKNNQFHLDQLWDFCRTPIDGFDGISSILVEGGPRTWETFFNAGVVDEEVILTNSPLQ